jgi:cytochrome oxidase assembly protein ShyY1
MLRPRWLAWHVTLVAVLVAFTLLGRWQLGSYEDSGRDRTGEERPVALSSVARAGDRLTDDAVGSPVTARGSYDPTGQLLVPGREHRGERGFLVVSPLRTGDGVLPVVRGWVATATNPAVRAPTGPVTATGVLQPSETEADSTIDPFEPLPEGRIPYVSTVQVLGALPVPEEQIFDGYLALTAQRPSTEPSPALVEPRELDGGVGRWRNLAYALQWWLFAGAAVFFWWAVIRRSARDRGGAGDGGRGDGPQRRAEEHAVG